jgi:UDP-2-acetamido-3-amino-2,3-dideoxy-glucuronate N-acetyltransferase
MTNQISTVEKAAVIVHESSYVDEPCEIGEGTRILHFSHVMKDTIIGRNCQIGHNVVISSGAIIGNHVAIGNNVTVISGVVLEDEVQCGPSVVFAPEGTGRPLVEEDNGDATLKTTIRKGASVGANTTIVGKITVGCYACVGAGSVVTGNVPDYALIYGNPARLHGWICVCGNELQGVDEKIACQSCQKIYQHSSKGLLPLS